MNAWRIEELVSLKFPPSEEDTDHNGLSDLIHFKTHTPFSHCFAFTWSFKNMLTLTMPHVALGKAAH